MIDKKMALQGLLLIIVMISCSANNNNEINHYNKILQNILPQKIRGIRILEEKYLILNNYKKIYNYNAERIFKEDLIAYNKGEFSSILEYDFNNNKNIDVVLSCIEPLRKKSHVIIIEKVNGKYKFIQDIQFNKSVVFLYNNIELINKRYIPIYFQSGTDNMILFYWNGEQYIQQIQERP